MPNVSLTEFPLLIVVLAVTLAFWGLIGALGVSFLRWLGVLGPKLTQEDLDALRVLRAEQKAREQANHS
jgi:hypothetical protein